MILSYWTVRSVTIAESRRSLTDPKAMLRRMAYRRHAGAGRGLWRGYAPIFVKGW